MAKAPSNVRAKTAVMIREGYKPTVASAAAWNMRRRHKLGPRGGYTRTTNRPKGPRGAQRRTMHG